MKIVFVATPFVKVQLLAQLASDISLVLTFDNLEFWNLENWFDG